MTVSRPGSMLHIAIEIPATAIANIKLVQNNKLNIAGY